MIKGQKGKTPMMPEPLVELSIEDEVNDYLGHAMLAKQLSTLPEG